jgi:hypothetical protein
MTTKTNKIKPEYLILNLKLLCLQTCLNDTHLHSQKLVIMYRTLLAVYQMRMTLFSIALENEGFELQGRN